MSKKMSARDFAVLRHHMVESQKPKLPSAADLRREEEKRREERAKDLVSDSILGTWFPGIGFDVKEFGSPGASPQYLGTGDQAYVLSDDGSLYLHLDRCLIKNSQVTSKIEVRVVRWVPALRRGNEGYYYGQIVHGPEEIGRYIAVEGSGWGVPRP